MDQGAGQGTFKDDGSVPKPTVTPKKAAPAKADVKPGKKGPAPAGGKSGKPDQKAQSDQVATKALKDGLDGLKKNEPYSKAELSKALGALKTKVKGVSFNTKPEVDKWIVTASGGGKKKSAGQIALAMKKEGAISAEAEQGLAALDQVTAGNAAKGATLEEMTAAIKSVRRKFKFKSLTVEKRGGFWYFRYEINPKGEKQGPKFDEATESLTPAALAPGKGQKTLAVGEGNFSFALNIAAKLEVGGKLVATDYVVAERATLNKTPAEEKRALTIKANIAKLTSMGVEVERQVDATNPASYPSGEFDVIVFNHPLVLTRIEGRTKRSGETANIELVRQFLATAKQKIKEGGKIIIISSEFRLGRWKLNEIAEHLKLEQKVLKFLASDFPEYVHEKTESAEAAKTVQTSEQFAIVFTIKSSHGT